MLPSPPKKNTKKPAELGKEMYTMFSLICFFLEDEEDEELVEPKPQNDTEIEIQEKKQDVKEGKSI